MQASGQNITAPQAMIVTTTENIPGTQVMKSILRPAAGCACGTTRAPGKGVPPRVNQAEAERLALH